MRPTLIVVWHDYVTQNLEATNMITKNARVKISRAYIIALLKTFLSVVKLFPSSSPTPHSGALIGNAPRFVSPQNTEADSVGVETHSAQS